METRTEVVSRNERRRHKQCQNQHHEHVSQHQHNNPEPSEYHPNPFLYSKSWSQIQRRTGLDHVVYSVTPCKAHASRHTTFLHHINRHACAQHQSLHASYEHRPHPIILQKDDGYHLILDELIDIRY